LKEGAQEVLGRLDHPHGLLDELVSMIVDRFTVGLGDQEDAETLLARANLF
jgi:hypothetical protein